MKFFAETLAFSFLFVLHMGRGDDPHENTRVKCRAELGLTEDEVMEGAKSPQPNLACYLKCILVDAGIMTPDGVMYPEKLVPKIRQHVRDESEPIIYACAAEIYGMEDACESSFRFWECFRQMMPDIFENVGVFGRIPKGRN